MGCSVESYCLDGDHGSRGLGDTGEGRDGRYEERGMIPNNHCALGPMHHVVHIDRDRCVRASRRRAEMRSV
jgi:hypothetical protein